MQRALLKLKISVLMLDGTVSSSPPPLFQQPVYFFLGGGLGGGAVSYANPARMRRQSRDTKCIGVLLQLSVRCWRRGGQMVITDGIGRHKNTNLVV